MPQARQTCDLDRLCASALVIETTVGAYTIDPTNFPMVSCVADGDITREQLEQHFKDYRSLLERNEPYTLIFDATTVGTVDVHTRKEYAEFLKVNEDDFRRLCRGTAFVIGSAMIRGALTAVLWLVGSMPFPYKIFSRRDEAEQWARQQLSRST